MPHSAPPDRDDLLLLPAFLFVPAAQERFITSALRSKPPAVILDLEDSIAAADKERARAAVGQATKLLRQAGIPVFVRVNRGDAADFAACRHASPDGVFLPKVESHSEPEAAVLALAHGAHLRPLIVATIETALGVLEAKAIAASTSVDALTFGVGDFTADAGFALDERSLSVPAALVALAARAAGKPALGLADGALATIDDLESLAASANAARRIGYTGAPVIHPVQIGAVERGFAPSADDVANARKVVAAFEASDGGAGRVNGSLIERPVYRRALAILRGSQRYNSSRAKQ